MSIQWSNIVVQIRFPDCQSKDPRSNSRWIHFYQVSIFYQLFSSHYYFNHCYRSIMNPRIVKNNNCDFAFYRLQYIFIHGIYLYYHLRHWRKVFKEEKNFRNFFFLETQKNLKTIRIQNYLKKKKFLKHFFFSDFS